ncbi:hypothetical protein SAMN05444157_0761 [Frankineae bacterium MT45]|nr:hypothetical protein SAMN05444157_0761 [Frankineae bacterium MT45]
MLSRILASTLAGALPPSMIKVERRRSMADRVAGRPGLAIGVSVTAKDKTLNFRAPDVGVVEASVSHTVRGIVLSTNQVTVAEWLDELRLLLNQMTADDAATREALERALLT